MASAFEKLWHRGAAAFLVKAIIFALAADALLLLFILLRRTYRKRYFAKRDARVFELRQNWDALISGQIPFTMWRKKAFDRRIVETMVLDAFEGASSQEAARLLKFLRTSGLIEKRIFEARTHTGWRRMRALVALGRTRAPEGIPALAEGLRDSSLETRLAALRGLGRTACPSAAEEILAWVGEDGLTVPALPLQSALVQCCAERPEVLLPHLQRAEGAVREVLARVLGEVANHSLSVEMLQFAEDSLDELRAAAARAISRAKPRLAFDALNHLAQDPVWFVRLRAIVSLGTINDPCVIPALLRGLTDSNRLVRLRAAEGLVQRQSGMASTFEQVVETRDRYGLHAYLTALENSGLLATLEAELGDTAQIDDERKSRLQEVLRTGTLPPEEASLPESAPATAAFRA